eukprot:Opistho-2@48918
MDRKRQDNADWKRGDRGRCLRGGGSCLSPDISHRRRWRCNPHPLIRHAGACRREKIVAAQTTLSGVNDLVDVLEQTRAKHKGAGERLDHALAIQPSVLENCWRPRLRAVDARAGGRLIMPHSRHGLVVEAHGDSRDENVCVAVVGRSIAGIRCRPARLGLLLNPLISLQLEQLQLSLLRRLFRRMQCTHAMVNLHRHIQVEVKFRQFRHLLVRFILACCVRGRCCIGGRRNRQFRHNHGKRASHNRHGACTLVSRAPRTQLTAQRNLFWIERQGTRAAGQRGYAAWGAPVCVCKRRHRKCHRGCVAVFCNRTERCPRRWHVRRTSLRDSQRRPCTLR